MGTGFRRYDEVVGPGMFVRALCASVVKFNA
jgi:hypothetical protein